jgi:hypothetical protein
MSIMLEAFELPRTGIFQLDIHQTVDIKVEADAARRHVTRYAGDYIGDLLYGETPTLVLQAEGAVWRVPVVIATGDRGRLGQAGAIDVDVATGELRITETLIEEIKQSAHRLVARSSL